MVQESTDSFLYKVFFINPTIKTITISFPFDIQCITFSLNYFFYSKSFLTSFLQFFFIKTSNNFFTIQIINYVCTRNCIFNLLITKTSSDQFGVYPLAKFFLNFEILTWSATLNLGSFLFRFSCIWQKNQP